MYLWITKEKGKAAELSFSAEATSLSFPIFYFVFIFV